MPKFAYVGKFSDSGSKNSFYKMVGRKQGFKSFPNKELATFAHTVQKELASENLAPRVYSSVCKIRIPNYYTVYNKKKDSYESEKRMALSNWGYLTEIAKPYYCDDGECGGDCAWNGMCLNYYSIQDLGSEINECGIQYTDFHEGNLGYVTRGKKKHLVIVDVGRESIGSYDEERYPTVDFPSYDDDYEYGCNCTECRGIE